MKTNRIECKYCKELILRGATKCRFCGERQNKKAVGFRALQIAMLLFLLLLVPSLVFASIWLPKSNIFNKGISKVADETKAVPPSFEESLLLEVNKFRTENSKAPFESDIETCEIAKRMSGKVSPKTIVLKDYIDLCPTCNSVGMNLATDTVGVIDTLSLWKLDKTTNQNMLAGYKYGCVARTNTLVSLILSSKKILTNNVIDSAGGTKTNSNGSQIDCIGPDGKQFKSTMEECKSLNEKWGKTLDYMVNCNFSSACGGPRYVKKSECVDCVTKTGINTNTAPPVTSGSNKVPVYLTYYKYTTYCPQQNVSAVQAIDADIAKLAPKAAQDANACEADFKKNDSCWQTCNSTSTADWSKCSYGSAGYQTCMDTENAKYSSCITKCTNPSDSCKWAWGEVNNLSSQINNLCK